MSAISMMRDQSRGESMRDIDECMSILECAEGIDWAIPSDVLEDTLEYLDELKKLRLKESYDEFPESMGR